MPLIRGIDSQTSAGRQLCAESWRVGQEVKTADLLQGAPHGKLHLPACWHCQAQGSAHGAHTSLQRLLQELWQQAVEHG